VSGAFRNSFNVEGLEYNLGTTDFSMSKFREAKVLDLSTFLIPHVYRAKGDNILAKVSNFMSDKWDHVRGYDMFVLPMDKEAKRPDVPNVSFAITLLMLKNGIEFVVADPIHRGTDRTVRIINFSVVLRHLQDKRRRVQTSFDTMLGDDGLQMIMFQRGAGTPDDGTYKQMRTATGLGKSHVMHCHLTPGKYQQGLYGGNSGNCYRDFHTSVAKLLHEFNIVDPFSMKTEKRTVKTIYFVLDEFSAYAAYTAVGIMGYGLVDVASILAFRQGVYTPMKCSDAWLTPKVAEAV